MQKAFPRRALICGISGQDGAYLAQLLLSKGYEVWGTSRNPNINPFHALRALGIFEDVHLHSMAPENFPDVLQVFSAIEPHEVYNLTGQSSVGLSFEKPQETMSSLTISTLNQLEAIRFVDKKIRFFNAGSGEVFGDTGEGCADENSVFHPQSPYAIAKAASTWQAALYRKSYGMFACTGILFNHESPLRPERFVTKKIIDTVIGITEGTIEKLSLGNTDIRRDWGWAPDFAVAMWEMLNFDFPEDFVIATGESHSLQHFVEAVFAEAGLDWRKYVSIDPLLLRPSDPMISRGNPRKAKVLLNWRPSVVGMDVPRKMYREMLETYRNKAGVMHVQT